MRVVLFGDGLWATRCLERLQGQGHSVLGVVLRSNPSESSLEDLASHLGIPVRAPDQVNDPEFVKWVCSLGPDLNISVSYDQILRRPIIESAPLGFINAHAGKLPFYRGRNVINWAIINNEPEIGITVHYVDKGIDTGDIVLQRLLPIHWDDTYGTVLAKVQNAFPDLLADAVKLVETHKVHRLPQGTLDGSYFSGRVPGDEWVDWHDTSLNIYNKIRAITHPGPGARTILDGRPLIIWRARYDTRWPKYIATPGEVVGVMAGQGMRVKTGDSTLIVEEIQFEGEGEPERAPRFRVGTRLGMNVTETLRQLQREVKELRDLVATLQEGPAGPSENRR